MIADGKLTRLTTERTFTTPPPPFFASTGAKPWVSANGPKHVDLHFLPACFDETLVREGAAEVRRDARVVDQKSHVGRLQRRGQLAMWSLG